jgi:TolB-like protein
MIRNFTGKSSKERKLSVIRIYIFPLFFCALLLGTGCRSSSPTYHISPDVDFSFIKKVAVLPFQNLSNEKFAGEIVRQVVISEFLASGLIDVVVPGDVTTTLKTLDIKSTVPLNAEQIKAIGSILKVQAVIMGAVEQYGGTRYGNIEAPELTVTFIMADTTAGNIIWSITKTGGGVSFMARHFGAKSKTMSEIVLSVVREAIETFIEF